MPMVATYPRVWLKGAHHVGNAWRKVVQAHLGARPGNATNPHVRQIRQGLSSALQGIAGLRSNAGSAYATAGGPGGSPLSQLVRVGPSFNSSRITLVETASTPSIPREPRARTWR